VNSRRVFTMRKIQWTKQRIALLGNAPDSKVAKQLGCSVPVVCTKRRELGIPLCGVLIHWGQTELGMLGKLPDAKLAKLTGRTVAEIVAKRKELGRL
jgi:hypothetical protein